MMAGDTMQQDDTARYEHEQRHGLIHRLRVSVLYHQKRARFFDSCDKFSSAFAVLGSTTAVVKGLGADDSPWQIGASIAVAIVSTLALVYGFSARARLHNELARDFSKLLATVHAVGDWPGMEKIAGWCGQLYELESQEPAPMTAVLIACENQLQVGATGRPLVTMPWHYRWLGQIIDLPPLAPNKPESTGSP